MRCPHCNQELGNGDEYDLMKSHLDECPSDKAQIVRRKLQEADRIVKGWLDDIFGEGGAGVEQEG